METAIEAKSLRKSYKNVSVLDDVSFSVQRGKVFALLGSNGAGKTTTINILTTLIKADGGAATVAGHDVATRSDKVRKEISLTGQFAAVDNRLTGRENLLLIGDLRHVEIVVMDGNVMDAEELRTAGGFSGRPAFEG
jgi:ABC-2 type transport system ATP-binding protein